MHFQWMWNLCSVVLRNMQKAVSKWRLTLSVKEIQVRNEEKTTKKGFFDHDYISSLDIHLFLRTTESWKFFTSENLLTLFAIFILVVRSPTCLFCMCKWLLILMVWWMKLILKLRSKETASIQIFLFFHFFRRKVHNWTINTKWRKINNKSIWKNVYPSSCAKYFPEVWTKYLPHFNRVFYNKTIFTSM